MKSARRTKKICAVLAAVTLAAAAVYAFMFWDIRNKTTRASELSNDISQLENREKEFRAMEGVLSKTKEQRDEIARYLVRDKNVVRFIEFVERIAGESSLEIEMKKVDVASGGEQTSEMVEPLTLSLSTFGSRSGAMKFLRLLESMPYRADIDDVQIVRRKGGGSASTDGGSQSQEGRWQGAFTFRVLKLKQ